MNQPQKSWVVLERNKARQSGFVFVESVLEKNQNRCAYRISLRSFDSPGFSSWRTTRFAVRYPRCLSKAKETHLGGRVKWESGGPL
jgi:hypothetical protein